MEKRYLTSREPRLSEIQINNDTKTSAQCSFRKYFSNQNMEIPMTTIWLAIELENPEGGGQLMAGHMADDIKGLKNSIENGFNRFNVMANHVFSELYWLGIHSDSKLYLNGSAMCANCQSQQLKKRHTNCIEILT
uniref:Uncharacterized protein n=1 Tax=Romanomermis culicivorax TaxID=13658 RepID=A0A915JQU7_ROMCU